MIFQSQPYSLLFHLQFQDFYFPPSLLFLFLCQILIPLRTCTLNMITIFLRLFILLLPLLVVLVSCIDSSSPQCEQTCPGGNRMRDPLPYPFGFSPNRGIQLNCSDTGDIKIGQFVVQNVTADSILINFPESCNRTIDDLSQLQGNNFQMTWRNGLLLDNCTTPLNGCPLPIALLKSQLTVNSCSGGTSNNMSCYSNAYYNNTLFLNYGDIKEMIKCGVIFSSIAVAMDSSFEDSNWTNLGSSPLALNFRTLELGWWLKGDCNCSKFAKCTNFKIPTGGQGYRCKCNQGYVGDGFATPGGGCRLGSLHKSRTKRLLKIVLAVVGGEALVLGIVFMVVLVGYKRRLRNVQSETGKPTLSKLNRVSYYELLRVTDGYSKSNLLGTGAFGSVYKGVLADGTVSAIKVFNSQQEGAFKSFDKECEAMRCLRHRNLTNVISSCANGDFQALVLEYMPNGSLDKWLYSNNKFLDLIQRLDIMINVAYALEYLHHGLTTPVAHCDLKPSNILLDEDMVAHVSDFGLLKIFSEETNAFTITFPTLGYIAPEYGLEGLVSARCDTYSFGIVLMEVFTRRNPNDEMFAEEISLRSWVQDSLVTAAVLEVVDVTLLRPDDMHFGEKLQCVTSIMNLAMKCSTESASERANMKDVVTALEKIKVQFLTSCART